jgi:hypothetical protein
MKKNILHSFYLLLIFGIYTSCNQEKSNNSSNSKPNYTITAEFNRIPVASNLSQVEITATIKNHGVAVNGITPNLSVTRGSLSPVTSLGNGKYKIILTPTQTGEHPITITYKDQSLTRTALVLSEVDSAWGQAMSVPGYVNTAGYEDGVTITPDGEYLFVQTGPQYFMGVFAMLAARANTGCGGALNRLVPTRCGHKWVNELIGTYTAPERPGFFDGRFMGMSMRHNANSWGMGDELAPNYAMATMFYGFKRQSDGSFKEPFYLAFEDVNDAIMNPFGLSFMMNGDGTATTLFSFNDPTDPDMVDFDGNGSDDAESYFDVFTTQVQLGQNNSFGEFVYSGTPGTHPVRGSNFNSTLVNFGKVGINGIAGTQGNSHIYYDESKNIKSIWVDDEFDSGGDHGELSVHVLTSGVFPNGTWVKVTLPNKVNIAGASDEIQPFFTGDGLYFTRSGIINPEVWYVEYTGADSVADYANNANWGTPRKILAMDTLMTQGRVTAVGEPTIAKYKGETYLYFVYGYLREFDGALPAKTGLWDVDMQAGFIKLN